MTDEAPEKVSAPPEPPMWLRATLEDIEGFDFEAPLSDLAATKSRLLFDPFHAAMKDAEARQDGRSTRVFCMLAAVTNMFFRPRDTHEPFGPMTVMSNGSRSATPADFRGHVEQLSNMALRATNPVLRARLGDVTWVLDRKRALAATAAISSYVEIVNSIRRNEPDDREEHDFGVLCHDVQEYLRRALQIGRAIGWDKPETLAARGLGMELRELAFHRRKAAPIYWFSYLDLDFDLSPSERVSEALEAHLALTDGEDEVNHVVSLWRLTSTAKARLLPVRTPPERQATPMRTLYVSRSPRPSASVARSLSAPTWSPRAKSSFANTIYRTTSLSRYFSDPYNPDTIYACWLIFLLCLKPLYPYRAQIVLPECS